MLKVVTVNVEGLPPSATLKKIYHLKLCLAAVTHIFKWVKITPNMCLIWEQNCVNLNV